MIVQVMMIKLAKHSSLLFPENTDENQQVFCVSRFCLFVYFEKSATSGIMYCLVVLCIIYRDSAFVQWYWILNRNHSLFIRLTNIFFFNKIFIINEFYNIIYIFKNYFIQYFQFLLFDYPPENFYLPLCNFIPPKIISCTWHIYRIRAVLR